MHTHNETCANIHLTAMVSHGYESQIPKMKAQTVGHQEISIDMVYRLCCCCRNTYGRPGKEETGWSASMVSNRSVLNSRIANDGSLKFMQSGVLKDCFGGEYMPLLTNY